MSTINNQDNARVRERGFKKFFFHSFIFIFCNFWGKFRAEFGALFTDGRELAEERISSVVRPREIVAGRKVSRNYIPSGRWVFARCPRGDLRRRRGRYRAGHRRKPTRPGEPGERAHRRARRNESERRNKDVSRFLFGVLASPVSPLPMPVQGLSALEIVTRHSQLPIVLPLPIDRSLAGQNDFENERCGETSSRIDYILIY